MTAFIKLLEFISKLPEELQPEYRQLIDNYADERDKMQSKMFATLQATTGKLSTNPIQTIEGC